MKHKIDRTKLHLPMILIIFGICLVILNLANCVRHIYIYGIPASDFQWIWKECACALKGIDVATAIRESRIIDGIGAMPPTIATVPWGRILGNVVHAGFLPEKLAFIYGVIIYTISIVFTWYIVTKKMVENNFLSRINTIVLCMLILLGSFYWVDDITFMNNGFIISFLVLLAMMVVDEHEYIAGFLLAIAMLKPQIALLFYITLLLKKKYRTIISSGIWCLISWAIYLLYVGGNPINQLMELLQQSGEKAAGFIWFGYWDFLTRFGVSGTIAMFCSMIMGIVVTAVLSCYLIKKGFGNDTIIMCSVPAMISTGWCYKSTSDWIILCFPLLIIFYLLRYAGINFKTIACGSLFLLLMEVKVFSGGVRRILGYEWLVGVSLDAWIRLIAYIGILLYVVYKYSEQQIER